MPTPVQHTYDIAADTLNGVAALDALEAEIQQSTVVAAIDYAFFRTDGNVLTVGLKDTITGDDTALDAVVAAHTGETLAEPAQLVAFAKMVEGAPVVAANTWPIEQSVVWCGEGDDITNGTVGGGTEFRIQAAAAGDSSIECQFLTPIRLGGGYIYWQDCAYADYAEMKVLAPATVATSNAGSGAYGKLAIGGGASVFVHPATPGADGPDWDIDLDETLNANVSFTKAVPVPAIAGDGFFTYADEVLTYTPGVGTHNLFDVPLDLNKFARKLWMMGTAQQSLNVTENIPATILPQWKCKVTVHRELGTGSDRLVTWTMLISRTGTV